MPIKYIKQLFKKMPPFKKGKVAWFIPPLIEGSGGIRTILNHAQMLESVGFECHIYIEGHHNVNPLDHIKSLYGYDFTNAYYDWRTVYHHNFELAFATVWYSAEFVFKLNNTKLKCYFVQDYEAYFHPMGDAYLLAENSYRYPLQVISIGKWLSVLLQSKYGAKTSYFDFCADLKIYRQLPHKREKENDICFIYQPDKPRRCNSIGIKTLEIVLHKRPQTKVVLYGSREQLNSSIRYGNVGIISPDECNNLYNNTKVGLCLSASNPSRIPFEMQAAGLPVVELDVPSTEYDFAESGVIRCPPTPEALADALIQILDSSELRDKISHAGVKFMKNRDLSLCESQFLNIIKDLHSTNKITLN